MLFLEFVGFDCRSFLRLDDAGPGLFALRSRVVVLLKGILQIRIGNLNLRFRRSGFHLLVLSLWHFFAAILIDDCGRRRFKEGFCDVQCVTKKFDSQFQRRPHIFPQYQTLFRWHVNECISTFPDTVQREGEHPPDICKVAAGIRSISTARNHEKDSKLRGKE